MIDPAADLLHDGKRMLDAQKRTLDIDAVHPIELFRAHLLDDFADVDAGIVHEDIEAAHILLDLTEHPLPVGLLADIKQGKRGVAALVAQLCRGRRPRFLVDVGDVDDGAFSAEGLRDGVADALGATGNQSSLGV